MTILRQLQTRKFAGEDATVQMKDGLLILETSQYIAQLFSEGTTVVLQKRIFANDPKMKVYDTASYTKEGILESITLGRKGLLPGATYKIVGENGEYEVLVEGASADLLTDKVVRSNGRLIWPLFKGFEERIAELRNDPHIILMRGGQA